MPLSWSEIRNRTHEFSRRWEGEESERAEAQTFWGEPDEEIPETPRACAIPITRSTQDVTPTVR